MKVYQNKCIKILTISLLVSGVLMNRQIFSAAQKNSGQKSGSNTATTMKNSEDARCEIILGDDQIILQCDETNSVYVTPEGVGVKTPSNSEFWGK